jgi:hypothetical protein
VRTHYYEGGKHREIRPWLRLLLFDIGLTYHLLQIFYTFAIQYNSMDFDRYFVIYDEDLQDADESICEWEDLGDTNHKTSHQTYRIQICIEDRLQNYISKLHSNRHQTQMDEHLTKPLPPVPEEPEAGSMPIPAIQNAAPLRRRPRAGSTTTAGTDNRPMSICESFAPERPASSYHDRPLSLWPKAHASDMRKAGRTSAIILQRHIDSSYHPNFESLHSKESCDLDQWANDIYGPQDTAMTSLRDKRRGVSPNIPATEYYREPIPMFTKGTLSKSYQDSTHRSSTSAGSYTDHERNSSYSSCSPSGTLTEYSDRGRSEDTNATSFFDLSDEDEESECTSEKRSPAKTFWRKMASSLRPTKSNASMRRPGMPEIDLRPVKSNTSMRRSYMPSIDLRLAKSNASIRRSGMASN